MQQLLRLSFQKTLVYLFSYCLIHAKRGSRMRRTIRRQAATKGQSTWAESHWNVNCITNNHNIYCHQFIITLVAVTALDVKRNGMLMNDAYVGRLLSKQAAVSSLFDSQTETLCDSRITRTLLRLRCVPLARLLPTFATPNNEKSSFFRCDSRTPHTQHEARRMTTTTTAAAPHRIASFVMKMWLECEMTFELNGPRIDTAHSNWIICFFLFLQIMMWVLRRLIHSIAICCIWRRPLRSNRLNSTKNGNRLIAVSISIRFDLFRLGQLLNTHFHWAPIQRDLQMKSESTQ